MAQQDESAPDWTGTGLQAAARRRLAEQDGPPTQDQGRTFGGFLANATQGAERGKIGGPWGAAGGALSEGLMGLIGGQKTVDKWRRITPGPESVAAARKLKKRYDEYGNEIGTVGVDDLSNGAGTETIGDLGEGSGSMTA